MGSIQQTHTRVLFVAPFRRYGGLKIENGANLYLTHPHLTPSLRVTPFEFRYGPDVCKKTIVLGF